MLGLQKLLLLSIKNLRTPPPPLQEVDSIQDTSNTGSSSHYILLVAENKNLDGAKAPGLNDCKCPLYF